MNLGLTEEETAVLLRELDGIISTDRYFLSPRITMLKAIRTKLRPSCVIVWQRPGLIGTHL